MPQSIRQIRATAAALLSKALHDLFPKIELVRGRVVDHGFTYDIYTEGQEIDSHALQRLEERMLELIRERVAVKNVQMLRENAVDYFMHHQQPLKAALVEQEDCELLELIQVGGLIDFLGAAGVEELSGLRFFKLLKCEFVTKNHPDLGAVPMQQISGTAFDTKDGLKHYLKKLASSKYYDHVKLGQGLKLFYLDESSPEEGVYWLDRGLKVKNSLSGLVESIYHEAGFGVVQPPSMAVDKSEFMLRFFKQSGGEEARFADISYVARVCSVDFDPMGLWRSPYFFADQLYDFVKEQNLSKRLISSLQMITKIVNIFATDYCWVLRRTVSAGGKRSSHYEKALACMVAALDECGIKYSFEELSGGDSGPCVCLYLPDLYGKQWRCSSVTVNLEVSARATKERKEKIYLVEGSLLGSFDRLIAYLLELHQGCLPFIVSPEQVRVISQRATSHAYAEEVASQVRAIGVRVETDLSEEKLGAKIHRAEEDGVPVVAVVGDQEVSARTVALRSKTTDAKMETVSLMPFLEGLQCKNKLNKTVCSP